MKIHLHNIFRKLPREGGRLVALQETPHLRITVRLDARSRALKPDNIRIAFFRRSTLSQTKTSMSHPDEAIDQEKPDRRIVVAALGVTQILAWGSTFYLLGVLGNEIARNTGWSYYWVTSGVSIGLLMAGVVSPRVGRAISK